MQISQRTRSPSDVRLILILADSFVTPQADGEITSLVPLPRSSNTTIRFSSSHSAAIQSLHQYLYKSIPGWFVHPWENKDNAWLELQTKVREDFTTCPSVMTFVLTPVSAQCFDSVLLGAFNHEKVQVGAFSVILKSLRTFVRNSIDFSAIMRYYECCGQLIMTPGSSNCQNVIKIWALANMAAAAAATLLTMDRDQHRSRQGPYKIRGKVSRIRSVRNAKKPFLD